MICLYAVLLLTFLQWPLIYQPVHCQQDQLNACNREGWSLMSDSFPEHEQLNNCRITGKMCYFILLCWNNLRDSITHKYCKVTCENDYSCHLVQWHQQHGSFGQHSSIPWHPLLMPHEQDLHPAHSAHFESYFESLMYVFVKENKFPAAAWYNIKKLTQLDRKHNCFKDIFCWDRHWQGDP